MKYCTCGDNCNCNIINKSEVNKIASYYNNNPTIENYQKLLQIVSESTKFKILLSLSKNEMCSCDLAFITDVTKSNVSHQMKMLVKEEIVSKEKRGREVYYKIKNPFVLQIINGYKGMVD